MRPTVLHVFSGDLWAGAEVVVFHLLSHLKAHGPLNPIALSLNDGVLTAKLQTQEVETHVLPEARLSFAAIAMRAGRLFQDRSISIIHSHGYKQNVLATLLSFRLRRPALVTTIHGATEIYATRSMRRTMLTTLDRVAIKVGYSRIIAVSRDIADHLIRRFRFDPARIEVIHNGIPLPRFTHVIDPHRGQSIDAFPHIGTVGRLVLVKDYALFLEVAARLRQTISSVRFSILGDGPLREALARRACELGLDDCISFVPPCDDPSSYYDSLDLYLNTSQHEGIPLSVLEAMAHGVPVVAPRVGGLPEILSNGQDENLISERHPDAFARRCIALLTNTSLWHSCSREAAAIVRQRFSAERMATAYASLYDTVLQTRAGQKAAQG
jgi:L-malate glycosyltransferase